VEEAPALAARTEWKVVKKVPWARTIGALPA
jgi:hypothetical protein